MWKHWNDIVIVPMFPHTLSSRPIVIDGNSTIKLVIHKSNRVAPHLSCDGQIAEVVQAGEEIIIKKHQQRIRLIHPTDYDYYQTLRTKLGWESKHTNGKG